MIAYVAPLPIVPPGVPIVPPGAPVPPATTPRAPVAPPTFSEEMINSHYLHSLNALFVMLSNDSGLAVSDTDQPHGAQKIAFNVKIIRFSENRFKYNQQSFNIFNQKALFVNASAFVSKDSTLKFRSYMGNSTIRTKENKVSQAKYALAEQHASYTSKKWNLEVSGIFKINYFHIKLFDPDKQSLAKSKQFVDYGFGCALRKKPGGISHLKNIDIRLDYLPEKNIYTGKINFSFMPFSKNNAHNVSVNLFAIRLNIKDKSTARTGIALTLPF